MPDSFSADDSDAEVVRLDELRMVLATFEKMPSLKHLIRFMTDNILEDVRTELLDYGLTEEGNRISATYADTKLDSFEDAFETFVAAIVGEIAAVRLIHAITDLASARSKGIDGQIKVLEEKAEKFRAISNRFSPPEHLRDQLIDLGEALE